MHENASTTCLGVANVSCVVYTPFGNAKAFPTSPRRCIITAIFIAVAVGIVPSLGPSGGSTSYKVIRRVKRAAHLVFIDSGITLTTANAPQARLCYGRGCLGSCAKAIITGVDVIMAAHVCQSATWVFSKPGVAQDWTFRTQ